MDSANKGEWRPAARAAFRGSVAGESVIMERERFPIIRFPAPKLTNTRSRRSSCPSFRPAPTYRLR